MVEKKKEKGMSREEALKLYTKLKKAMAEKLNKQDKSEVLSSQAKEQVRQALRQAEANSKPKAAPKASPEASMPAEPSPSPGFPSAERSRCTAMSSPAAPGRCAAAPGGALKSSSGAVPNKRSCSLKNGEGPDTIHSVPAY
jgi:hypothetical protein